MKTTLILACAGKGERAKLNKNKLLFSVNGETCLEKTFSAFAKSGLIDEYIVVCAKTDEAEIKKLLPPYVKIAIGGETRTASVKNALALATGDITLIHDGARPFVDKKTIINCINSAKEYGSGIAAVPSRDTVCLTNGGEITDYLGKSGLFAIQTPQAFKTELIKKAYSLIGEKVFNDDGEIYGKFIGKARIVEGNFSNTKITFNEDFALLTEKPVCKIGVGFDCHKLVENRKLVLGGIEIPHDKGLLGHSDADVLTHAVMDALLSALSLRDIGYHFPDSDAKYKDADSMKLLEKVISLISEKGYKINNLSAVIMAEKPKLSPFIPTITANLAKALSVETECVGIGATTLEGLGFIGREEGICVRAAVTVIKSDYTDK